MSPIELLLPLNVHFLAPVIHLFVYIFVYYTMIFPAVTLNVYVLSP
jgi:hypothetical protein